jgi:hypothetical protein
LGAPGGPWGSGLFMVIWQLEQRIEVVPRPSGPRVTSIACGCPASVWSGASAAGWQFWQRGLCSTRAISRNACARGARCPGGRGTALDDFGSSAVAGAVTTTPSRTPATARLDEATNEALRGGLLPP